MRGHLGLGEVEPASRTDVARDPRGARLPPPWAAIRADRSLYCSSQELRSWRMCDVAQCGYDVWHFSALRRNTLVVGLECCAALTAVSSVGRAGVTARVTRRVSVCVSHGSRRSSRSLRALCSPLTDPSPLSR